MTRPKAHVCSMRNRPGKTLTPICYNVHPLFRISINIIVTPVVLLQVKTGIKTICINLYLRMCHNSLLQFHTHYLHVFNVCKKCQNFFLHLFLFLKFFLVSENLRRKFCWNKGFLTPCWGFSWGCDQGWPIHFFKCSFDLVMIFIPFTEAENLKPRFFIWIL